MHLLPSPSFCFPVLAEVLKDVFSSFSFLLLVDVLKDVFPCGTRGSVWLGPGFPNGRRALSGGPLRVLRLVRGKRVRRGSSEGGEERGLW